MRLERTESKASPATCLEAGGERVGRLSLHQPGLEIWRYDLDQLELAQALPELSIVERESADAFVHELHRTRYRRGRGLLRQILARALNRSPSSLVIDVDANGKPYLADDTNMQFNVSHCEHVWYLILGRGESVGIDVELHREIEDALEMAASVFSRDEIAELEMTPPDLISDRFLSCWTRKEALVKAIGVGLLTDVSQIHVGCDGRDAQVQSPLDGSQFAIKSMMPIPGEHLAIAYRAFTK